MIPGRQSSNPAKPASYRLILSLAIRGRPERARRRHLWGQRAAAADAGRSGGAGQHSADRDEMPTNGDDAQRSESGRARCWGCARTGAARRPSRRARRAPRPYQAHASAYLVDGGAISGSRGTPPIRHQRLPPHDHRLRLRCDPGDNHATALAQLRHSRPGQTAPSPSPIRQSQPPPGPAHGLVDQRNPHANRTPW